VAHARTAPLTGEAVLEVVSPDGARRFVRITQTPFMIGRGAETGNHLQLSDRRISRNCAAVLSKPIATMLRIAASAAASSSMAKKSTAANSRTATPSALASTTLTRSSSAPPRAADDDSIPRLLTRIEHITSSEHAGGGLRKLNLLLEATTLLHSQLPLDSVLGTMLDYAVSVTDAVAAFLLETAPTARSK